MRDATDQRIAGFIAFTRTNSPRRTIRLGASSHGPTGGSDLSPSLTRMGTTVGKPSRPVPAAPRRLAADVPQQRLDGLRTEQPGPLSPPSASAAAPIHASTGPRRSPDAVFFISLLDYPDCRDVLGYGV